MPFGRGECLGRLHPESMQGHISTQPMIVVSLKPRLPVETVSRLLPAAVESAGQDGEQEQQRHGPSIAQYLGHPREPAQEL